jgi:hypothetical protein
MRDDPSILHSLFHRVWPAALLILAVAVTISWIAVIGFGIIKLIEMVV